METRGPRTAFLGGCRTPFARAFTDLRRFTVLDLATIACAEAVHRAGVRPETLERVILGAVLTQTYSPNLAREVVLSCGWPAGIPGVTVSQACISSIAAVTSAADSIAAGDISVALAGGAESLSNIPLLFPKAAADAFVDAARARSFGSRLSALARLRPSYFLPPSPGVSERSTGFTMGDHAERMAKVNGISREAQDDFAHQSHVRAGEGWKDGRLAQEVVSVDVPPMFSKRIDTDNGVRFPPDREALAKLRPAFDRRFGSVTAGNASGLTDGAAALVVMEESRARADGRDVLGVLRSYAYAALPPEPQLLLGPALAIPIALDRAGLRLADMDLIDMHEAFAAQILSVTQALGSRSFASEYLGRSEAVGDVDPAKLNVLGGSIAVGHPFGATGARMIMQTLNELRRRNGRHALLALCAAGGMAAALVLERT